MQKTAYEYRISDWSSDVCSSDLQKLERKQAEESDYYNVLLWDEAARRQVRARTCCWVLDAERKPVTNEDGKRTYRDAHEVALDAWAAYGADDHTLICLQLWPVLPANAYSLASKIARSQQHPGCLDVSWLRRRARSRTSMHS